MGGAYFPFSTRRALITDEAPFQSLVNITDCQPFLFALKDDDLDHLSRRVCGRIRAFYAVDVYVQGATSIECFYLVGLARFCKAGLVTGSVVYGMLVPFKPVYLKRPIRVDGRFFLYFIR